MNHELKKGIDEAMKRERKSYELYSSLSRKSDNQNVSRLFSELAVEELKHEMLLREYLECLDVDEAKRRLEAKYTVLNLDIVDKINPNVSAIGLVEGFDQAIQREDSEARSYRMLAEDADDEAAAGLFKYLAEVENEHKTRIKREKERFFGS